MGDERILAIDIGAGTMDTLVYDPAQPMENAVQLVLPSATSRAAAKIAAVRGQGRPVFLHGNLMGGYHTTNAVWSHLQAGLAVFATETAARTVHDDVDLLRARGIVITDDPPKGAVLNYILDKKPKDDIVLEIRDKDNVLVQKLSSKKQDPEAEEDALLDPGIHLPSALARRVWFCRADSAFVQSLL